VKRVFVSDCEGPISKNDNAFELLAHFVPEGGKLFTRISKYDDVLADVIKKPGYNAGDTLKLILPFLKANDATDLQMRAFSAENILLLANSKQTLEQIRSKADAFIISTSYQHYIEALCGALGFPFENTFCTRLSLDRYEVSEEEKVRLKEMAREISHTAIVSIPSAAKSLNDFSEQDQKTILRLDEIFWNEISHMRIGKIFSEVKPIGGQQKAEAVKTAVKRSHVNLAEVVYVGDSITDVEAFRLVRNNGGLTVSFNGNEYAIRGAEIAVLSENSTVTAVIFDLFSRLGKEETLQVLGNWTRETLQQNTVNKAHLERLLSLYSGALPKVQIVTSENMEMLIRESSEFRKKVRGEAVGRLG
jgi:energy-converting hydrogenase A subunit R